MIHAFVAASGLKIWRFIELTGIFENMQSVVILLIKRCTWKSAVSKEKCYSALYLNDIAHSHMFQTVMLVFYTSYKSQNDSNWKAFRNGSFAKNLYLFYWSFSWIMFLQGKGEMNTYWLAGRDGEKRTNVVCELLKAEKAKKMKTQYR